MKKIILLFFTGAILQSCNGQRKQTEKFDLDSINFTENINSILNKMGSQLSEFNHTDNNPPSINKKEIGCDENSDIWTLMGYKVITINTPENIYFKEFSLSGSKLNFDYDNKDHKIGMYMLNITDEKKGDELILFLEKKLGIPKIDSLISPRVSYSSLGDDCNKNISQIGYVWKNITGKTYCLVKFSYINKNNNKKYLGHHLAVINSKNEYFIEVLTGEWYFISDILTED